MVGFSLYMQAHVWQKQVILDEYMQTQHLFKTNTSFSYIFIVIYLWFKLYPTLPHMFSLFIRI